MKVRLVLAGVMMVLLAVGAAAQDDRTLSLGALRFSADGQWLHQLSGYDFYRPTLGLKSSLLGDLGQPGALGTSPSSLGESLLTPSDVLGPTSFWSQQSQWNYDRRVARVFNLSVAVANLKQAGWTTSTSRRSMSFGPTPSSRRGGGAGDVWAVDVGLDYHNRDGHGLRVGYLAGRDPVTREADAALSDQKGVDFGYSVDLDGLYLNLGYVYTFGSLYASRDASPESTVYLRFQLRF